MISTLKKKSYWYFKQLSELGYKKNFNNYRIKKTLIDIKPSMTWPRRQQKTQQLKTQQQLTHLTPLPRVEIVKIYK